MSQSQNSVKRITNVKGEQISLTDRFMSMKEITALCSISRTTIKRLMAKAQFPPSIHITDSREVWIESDVQEWRTLGGQAFKAMYGKKLAQQAAATKLLTILEN